MGEEGSLRNFGNMARTCDVCGRRLRTGTKYCYTCRSIQKAGSIQRIGGRRRDYSKLWAFAFVGVLLFVMSLFDENKVLDIVGGFGLIFGVPLLIGLILMTIANRKKLKNSHN